jgi:signal transduction histidine kinase
VHDQGVGTDGGIDIIAEQHLLVHEGYAKRLLWGVQVKHKAVSSHTVKPTELGNILNLLARFRADGYLLITNGRVTNKTFAEIRSITLGGPPSHLADVWDNAPLTSRLIKHGDLMQRYFAHALEKRVLVVDDVEVMAKTVAGILSAVGHSVSIAHSIEEARRLVDLHPFDVAILDIRLSDDNPVDTGGFAVADLIRRRNPDTRIVYHSGYISTRTVMDRALAENAVVLSKFDTNPTSLRAIVADALAAPTQYVQRSALLRSVEQLVEHHAHYLSSIVLSVRLNMELVLEKTGGADELRKPADRLRELLDSLQYSVRNISTEFRELLADDRDRSFVVERVDELVREALKASIVGRARRTEVAIEVPETLELECHGPSVRASLAVIIQNALDALGDTTASAGSAIPEICISATDLLRERQFIEMRVSDQGKGFPEQVLRSFTRGGFTTKQGGTGMGLLLASRTAELHGGWLDIRSPWKDWSSSVAMVLPLKRNASGA